MAVCLTFEQIDGTFDSADIFHIIRNLHDVARIHFGVLLNLQKRCIDWWTCVSTGYVQIITLCIQGLVLIRWGLTIKSQICV